MANVTIQLTGLSDLQKMQAFLSPATFAKAQRAGTRYAAKSVPPAVAKGISSAYNIRSARVKEGILGTRFVDEGEAAIIRFSRRPPTLRQFNPNPGKRGHQPGMGRGMGWDKPKPKGRPLSAVISKAQGRQTYPTSFLATGLSGNALVLRRSGSGPAARLIGVYGPSIGSIFLGQSSIGPQLRATVQERIQEQYIKGFERQMSAAARGFGQ
jgi:hypothetical protein